MNAALSARVIAARLLLAASIAVAGLSGCNLVQPDALQLAAGGEAHADDAPAATPGAVGAAGGGATTTAPQLVSAVAGASTVTASAGVAAADAKLAPLVCVDPGHQRIGNHDKEPAGPDSEDMKTKVSYGTKGVATRKPEYELTLEVSLKLRDKLQEAGYRVVMVRDHHDVDISNKERALLCNEAKSDVALRIHADGFESSSARGISVLYPSTGAQSAVSKKLAAKLLEELIYTTKGKSRGIIPRNDLTGLNWSNVPSVLLEMGFMTNPEEDELLSTDEYQEKLVTGMLNFVVHSFPLSH